MKFCICGEVVFKGVLAIVAEKLSVYNYKDSRCCTTIKNQCIDVRHLYKTMRLI